MNNFQPEGWHTVTPRIITFKPEDLVRFIQDPGNGDGTFGTPLTFLEQTYSHSIAVGDFNLDGKPDLAILNSAQGSSILILKNTSY